MRILVTGATGFVGKSLVPLLSQNGHLVRMAIRNVDNYILKDKSDSDDQFNFDLNSNDNNYERLLNDVDVVIHLAARVHILGEAGNEAAYKKINSIGTERLAKEAAERGVKRFIFLSSIKVNGEKNLIDAYGKSMPFNEGDVPYPQDTYASSKLEGEVAIRNVCSSSDMDFVILRPVLVYGPGVKANFLLLLNAVNKYYPLPLASVRNKRSLIYVNNLADAITKCVNTKKKLNKTFLISDFDISVPDLIRVIAQYLNKQAFLFSFPVGILKTVGLFMGKKQAIDRLTESMLVDNSRFREELKWKPPHSLNEGVQATVDWYMQD